MLGNAYPLPPPLRYQAPPLCQDYSSPRDCGGSGSSRTDTLVQGPSAVAVVQECSEGRSYRRKPSHNSCVNIQVDVSWCNGEDSTTCVWCSLFLEGQKLVYLQ